MSWGDCRVCVVVCGFAVVDEVSLGLRGLLYYTSLVGLVISLRGDGAVGLMVPTMNNSYSFGEM